MLWEAHPAAPVMHECPVDYHHTYSNSTHRLVFNLCPLFLQQQAFKHELNEETPPTHTRHVYEIALGRGIRRDGTLPADLQCAVNSFICLTTFNTRPNHPSEPPRILQVVTVASEDIRPKFRLTNTTTGSDLVDNHLQLTVHGSQYQGQKQKAVFHMFCDETNTFSKPEVLYRWNGTHAFSWRSSYACPKIATQPNNQPPEPGDDPREEFPPPDPEPETSSHSSSSVLQWLIIFAILMKWLVRQKYAYHLRSRLSSRRRYYPQESELLLEEFGPSRSTGDLQYLQPNIMPHKYTI